MTLTEQIIMIVVVVLVTMLTKEIQSIFDI